MNRQKRKHGTFSRLMKLLFKFNPRLLPTIIALILVSSIISALPSIFQQNVVAVLEQAWANGWDWAETQPRVLHFVLILAALYVCGLTINTLNKGAIADLPDDAGVEITCLVSRHGIQRPHIGKLPSKIAGLVHQVKCYEMLTVDAAVRSDKSLALQALLCNPLVHGFSNAEKVLAAMESRTIFPASWKEE